MSLMLHWIASVLSAEFLLKQHPNGGAIVAARSAYIAILIYLCGIGLRSSAAAGWSCGFDFHQLSVEVSETVPWFGAIVAAVYVALYSRFSAQWSYLSSVYNEIMATEAAVAQEPRDGHRQWPPPPPSGPSAMEMWKAGFVEDAVTLHLATKTIFAELVWILLQDPNIRESFDNSATSGGIKMRKKLEQQLLDRFPGLSA